MEAGELVEKAVGEAQVVTGAGALAVRSAVEPERGGAPGVFVYEKDTRNCYD